MNVAFKIDAGPLATIGLQIFSLDQAIQLASGAYGWYKAQGRTQSLTQLLSAKGASLVSTSAFDVPTYLECRSQSGQVLGVVVQDGEILSTELPEACTARPRDPSQACLRALTTGLLCFFNANATTLILAELIPYAMLQMNQEGVTIKMEGPLLTSLKQCVEATATEEDSNTIRTDLLEIVSNHQAPLANISLEDTLYTNAIDMCEAPLILGFLKWMFTPRHKRDSVHYPTRSLRVWSLAPIMNRLGFQISVSARIVRTTEDYAQATNPHKFIAEWPEVILIATNVGITDLCVSDNDFFLEEESRPQVVPLRGVPFLAFRHLRGSNRTVNAEFLADVWTYSYKKCREGLEVSWTDPVGHIRLVPGQDHAVHSEHHAALLQIFSPHLAKVCGKAMSAYVPYRSEGADWLPERLEEQLRILRRGEDAFQSDASLRDNCYILIAIVLGSLYGIASIFCRDGNEVFSLDSEVAFHPEFIYQSRFKTWATLLSLPLCAPPSYKDWNNILLEVILGHKASDLNGRFPDGDSAVAQDGQNGVASSTQLPIGIVLGAQANGIAAVLELLIRPSMDKGAVSVFHIQRGQMLSFPVGPHGYIEASQRQELGLTMTLDPSPSARELEIKTNITPDTSMRIDAEPCWEGNPQTVVLRCRSDGALLCPLNIEIVVRRLQQASVPCTCGQPVLLLSMPTSDWIILDINHLTRRTLGIGTSRRVDLRGDSPQACNVFVDASQSEAATMYAIGSIQCQDMFICHGCLKCLELEYKKRWRKGGCVIVNAAVSVPAPALTKGTLISRERI